MLPYPAFQQLLLTQMFTTAMRWAGQFFEGKGWDSSGTHWVAQFRRRHPDLKAKWATGLEKCRAQALNKPAVDGYFEMLEELIVKYKIEKHIIYNMNKKGKQLGVGGRVRAIVDRDQKTVHQVEDGNREMVTFIDCAAADGSMLSPTVVFKGVRRNLEWGRQNPVSSLRS